MVVEEEYEVKGDGESEQGEGVARCELGVGWGVEGEEGEAGVSWRAPAVRAIDAYLYQLEAVKVREVDSALLRQEHWA